jgi:hypothetical protein
LKKRRGQVVRTLGWASQSEMQMILKRHTVFDTMGDFDPVTGTLTMFSRAASPERVPSQLSGLFDEIGGKLVLLFRLNGILYLQIGHQRMAMDDHTIELQSANGYRILRFLSGRRVAFELRYDRPIIDPPLSEDPTPFVEEEHFDFGLSLANLSRDRGRQARMFSGYSGPL